MDDAVPYVIGLGAATPIGRSTLANAAAVRAGVSGLNQHPYMIDSDGEPMKVACAPWLDIDLEGTQRFQALLASAIDEVLQAHAPRIAGLRTAIAVGLPAPRPGLPADLPAAILAAISSRYSVTFAASALFPNGHAAGLLALDGAIRKLASSSLDACIVAGVDSYIEPETLEWLDASDQLHGGGKFNNAWGFIPGEGAGALLVIRGGLREQFEDSLLAQLLGVGTGIEPNRIKTDTVCIGEGLTQAFKGALQSLPRGEAISDVYCDMNGEPYRADEYGFSCLRVKERLASASDFIAPADCWGDVGAAGAPLHIGLAAVAGSKGYAAGGTAFVWASSEGGERAATVLRVRAGARRAG